MRFIQILVLGALVINYKLVMFGHSVYFNHLVIVYKAIF